ncbi:hypothetical protein Rhopal_005343-T1 [Rhodotorula paludigena]|uniref:Rieske domain-containing protein n=1 Tax=Rhodotorula paludigena TaxID=86838 RepID=A0AAV5GQ62_9BASI|nr:hypothetical protein Rhopal_005343-T1 [Rhodotorula paludigena]
MPLARIQVGPIDLLKDGQMKEIPFPKEDSENKILLSKIKGQYYANSSKCTHYGAPLAKGVLTESGRLVCPWHDVCSNGDIEDAPGIDSLQSFKVETDGSYVYVHADDATVSKTREPAAPSIEIGSSSPHANVLIVGGGPGAAHAIEALRDEGFTGSIRVVSKEPHLPIDRTKISKALISDPGKLALRSKEFYDKQKVEFVLGTEATKLDFANATVELASGDKATYDHLILATGATPTKIPLDGIDLGNIFTVRGVADAEAITSAVGQPGENDPKKSAVIVGSSFIGMEVALALAGKASLTVVGMEETPFSKILGPAIGNGIRKFHEGKGTKFVLPAELSHFAPSESDKSKVGAVHLKDGSVLPADLVVLGTGVKPASQLLKDAGLELEKNGSVRTDDVLEIEQLKGKSKGRVFALGDLATFDSPKGVNYVQHWNVASNHGRTIAHLIATQKREAYDKIAVFWSAQGQQLRYAGSTKASEWDDVVIDGNPDELKFVAYYTKGEEVVAAASMQRDPIVAHCSELLKLDKMPTKSELQKGKNPLDIPLSSA